MRLWVSNYPPHFEILSVLIENLFLLFIGEYSLAIFSIIFPYFFLKEKRALLCHICHTSFVTVKFLKAFIAYSGMPNMYSRSDTSLIFKAQKQNEALCRNRL